MDEQNSGFILCDISFNGQLIADVKLPRACSMGNIVQGLWLDDNFRKTGLEYLKAKEERESQNKDGETSKTSKSFGGIDRCILRAYVAIRIMPVWKWLEFKDFIVDFENKKDCYTVGDVLGTLCTGLHKPVLRIVPKSENEADDQEVKNIVNNLLKTKSLATLAAAECPLSNGMLSLIAQGKYTSTIGHDKCQAFIRWLRRQDLTNEVNAEEQVKAPKPNLPQPSPASKNTKPRITFSQNEIDNLTDWFNEDERPSREVMRQYTDILNIPRQISSVRLLTPESIYFWFKNQRSKRRREEPSILEPWEKDQETSGDGKTPEVTKTDADVAQVTMATSYTPGNGDTPQITMGIGDMGDNGSGSTPVSMAITSTGEGSGEIRMPINGLATMLARYSPQVKQGGYGESPTKARKIPKSRVTFDPQTELSSLNGWFSDNERPDKEIIEEYTNILNKARSQKSKRMLTTDSIAMWFKNRRAKRRRSEGNTVYPDDNSFSGEGEHVVQTIDEIEESKLNNVTAVTSETATTEESASMDVTPAVDIPAVAGVNIVSNTDPSDASAEQAVTSSEQNIYSAEVVLVKTNEAEAE